MGGSCTVEMKWGMHDRQNRDCIDDIAKVLKPSTSSDLNSKIIYIAHGWKETASTSWLIRLKNMLLKKYAATSNTVVGTVYWTRGASRRRAMNRSSRRSLSGSEKTMVCCASAFHSYGKAAVNTWAIGNVLGYLHEELVKENTFRVNSCCIGFSLGAHLCGFFGKMLKEMSEKVIYTRDYDLKRIIALDPAGPIFDDPLQNARLTLNAGDAYYVEVVKTNTETLGYTRPLGHLDFYINGGYRQPWCPLPSFPKFFDRWYNKARCSHVHAYALFMKYFNNDVPCYFAKYSRDKMRREKNFVHTKQLIESKFKIPCKNNRPVVYLGDLSARSYYLNGKYYVEADEQSRFCKYLRIVK
jgi:hypothetical protein